jgi:hypothetical protein
MNISPFPQERGWHVEFNRAPWIYPVLKPWYWFGLNGNVNEWGFQGETPGARWFTIHLNFGSWPFISYKGEKRSFYLGWKPYGIGGAGHACYDNWLPAEYVPSVQFQAADGSHGVKAVTLSATLRKTTP